MDAVSNKLPGEVGIAMVMVVLIGVTFYVSQSVIKISNTLQSRYLEVLPYTLSSEDKKLVIQQDIKKDPNAKPILMSENERTGIEFAYSFYLYVLEQTFQDPVPSSNSLKCVFYKGYDDKPWPLLAPGVFMLGSTNTMRIIFNSYDKAYNYVDIENIPVKKYVHVVLNFKKLGLEVYINGRLAKKLNFNDTLPYVNYGNLVLFNPKVQSVTISTSQSVTFNGSISGRVSNIVYTRYALSYNEIQNFLNKGPSKQMRTTEPEKPPYLANSWWTNQSA